MSRGICLLLRLVLLNHPDNPFSWANKSIFKSAKVDLLHFCLLYVEKPTCVPERTCSCVHMCVCTRVEVRGQPQLLFPRHLSTLLLCGRVSLFGLELLKQARLVTSEPQGSACLHFPSNVISNMYNTQLCFAYTGSGDWTWWLGCLLGPEMSPFKRPGFPIP